MRTSITQQHVLSSTLPNMGIDAAPTEPIIQLRYKTEVFL